MRAYVVMKVGYEYNDEVYHTSEEGGGEPVKAFRKRANAETLAAEMNASKFSRLRIYNYGYELEEVTSLPSTEVAKRLHKLGLYEGEHDAAGDGSVGEFDFSSFDVPDLPLATLLEVAKVCLIASISTRSRKSN